MKITIEGKVGEGKSTLKRTIAVAIQRYNSKARVEVVEEGKKIVMIVTRFREMEVIK